MDKSSKTAIYVLAAMAGIGVVGTIATVYAKPASIRAKVGLAGVTLGAQFAAVRALV